jgi:alternate signal-mediated exported protein
MKQKRSNKPLIAGVILAVVGVIGGTFAYFTSTDTFTNVFSTKPYVMEVTEVFESPTDWTPGTTTNKTVIATNKGDVPSAVRVKLTENWVDANGNPLPLVDNNNVSAAIINFAIDFSSNWVKNGNYYYYKKALSKNESTSSLLESVTFNSLVEIPSEDNCVTDDTTHTTICTTTTTGYAGGSYTLIVDVETVQYDQYRAAWNTTVSIAAPNA